VVAIALEVGCDSMSANNCWSIHYGAAGGGPATGQIAGPCERTRIVSDYTCRVVVWCDRSTNGTSIGNGYSTGGTGIWNVQSDWAVTIDRGSGRPAVSLESIVLIGAAVVS
jgi:hypothetical protein